MKKSGKCPKCGSKNISREPKLLTGGGLSGREGLGIHPDIFGNVVRHFEAFICGDCGFTEIYMPEKFLNKE
mgnify:CR=1 FL=1